MPTHFTEIAVGAPANADTFNDPLNDLDAAIVAEAVTRAAADDALNAELADIIADSGTSSTETVNARSAGNVGSAATTLTERLGWLEGATTVYAAAYGLDDGAAGAANTTALNAATAAAAAFGLPTVVMLPAGRFTLTTGTITLPANVRLRGAGMPIFDRGGGVLEGGTILVGATIALDDWCGLADMGVQVSGDRNAITGGSANDTIIENVATRGDTGGTRFGHGCVFSNGSRNNIINFQPNYHIHGLILKTSHNTVRGLNTWHCESTILGLYCDAGQDCEYNVCENIKGDGTTAGNAGAIYLKASSDQNVRYNTVSDINIHNGTFGIVLNYDLTNPGDCKYNTLGPGVIDTTVSAAISFDRSEAGPYSSGAGIDYNIFTGLVIKDAGSYSFANNTAPDAVANIITGCLSYSPFTGHVVGVFAQYGINQQSGLMAKVTKSSDQAISTGTGAWVDVTWTAEGGPFSIWNPDADNTAEVGGVPFTGAFYRLHAYIQFDPASGGNRYVQIVRDTGGGYSSTPFAVAIRSGTSASVSQSVDLVYDASMNTGYRFKVQVMQDSGGNLDVSASSYIVLQALK